MSASASMPMQYKRLYKGPLDADDVFETLEDAQNYAKGPTAYAGHVIGVLVDGGRKSYIVNDDGTLTEQVTKQDIINMLTWVEIE